MTKLSLEFRQQFMLKCFTLSQQIAVQYIPMNIKHIIGISLTAVMLAGCATEKSEAELMSEAKISKADAQVTALSQVPNGTVKEAELEKEKGKLIWSFDVSTPGTTDITEVNVDAITGKVVSKEIEKAEDEAKEAKGEKKEKD
jgi:peptidase YpeB-like protein